MSNKTEEKSQAWIINYLEREQPKRSKYHGQLARAVENGKVEDKAEVEAIKKILAKVDGSKKKEQGHNAKAPNVERPKLDLKPKEKTQAPQTEMLDFLNDELRFNPNDSRVQVIEKSRKSTPEDFKQGGGQ